MGCYCGCGTRANKLRWAMVVVGVILIAVFIGTSIGMSRSCTQCQAVDGQYEDECWDVNQQNPNRDPYWVKGCSRAGFNFAFWAFVVACVWATVPCYVMCCCSKPPPPFQAPQTVPIADPYK